MRDFGVGRGRPSMVDAHYEKEDAGLVPPSHFDIYLDRERTMFGVAKGEDPKFGTYIGPLPR